MLNFFFLKEVLDQKMFGDHWPAILYLSEALWVMERNWKRPFESFLGVQNLSRSQRSNLVMGVRRQYGSVLVCSWFLWIFQVSCDVVSVWFYSIVLLLSLLRNYLVESWFVPHLLLIRLQFYLQEKNAQVICCSNLF